jgi:hypothetical protein
MYDNRVSQPLSENTPIRAVPRRVSVHNPLSVWSESAAVHDSSHRSGQETLSILRKETANWLLARDVNLMA